MIAKDPKEIYPRDGTVVCFDVELVPARAVLKGVDKAKVEFRIDYAPASFDIAVVGNGTDYTDSSS